MIVANSNSHSIVDSAGTIRTAASAAAAAAAAAYHYYKDIITSTAIYFLGFIL